jgi:hypothetical protein
MKKKIKLKEQVALINSTLDNISCAFEINSNVNRELEKEKIEIEREKLAWEKETKDRVNISLAEYEELKRDLKHYKETAEHQQEVLDKIGVDMFIDSINLDTLTVQVVQSFERLNSKIHISFECNKLEPIPQPKREIGDYMNALTNLPKVPRLSVKPSPYYFDNEN